MSKRLFNNETEGDISTFPKKSNVLISAFLVTRNTPSKIYIFLLIHGHPCVLNTRFLCDVECHQNNTNDSTGGRGPP